jgi:hypothetical protein
MILTKTQKQLIESCLEKGFITLNDFWKFYSTQQSISRVGERLQQIGILNQDANGRLTINKEVFLENA